MLAGPTGKHHCETNTRDWVMHTLSMQCAGTVHVTSYLNFSAEGFNVNGLSSALSFWYAEAYKYTLAQH